MDKREIIYYTDNKLPEPLFSTVQKELLKTNLPIVSTSLKPISFGKNIVVDGQRSYPTMIKQILVALENSKEKYVFFCEHDVLYPKSHFDFIPPKNDVFYYNTNVWRWYIKLDYAVRYERMIPLSCLCVNREFALNHYKFRQKHIDMLGLDEFRSREPRWGRLWGYEPGTKKKRRGGLTDDDYDTWYSKEPVIDIRHPGTFSSPKVKLEEFKHKPKNYQTIKIKNIKEWNYQFLSHLATKSFLRKQ